MMPESALLIHLVGFGTGAALYSLLLWLALRARHEGESRPASALDDLPLLAGILGALWNLGGLFLLFRAVGWERDWISAIAFSALGFLPAVVVHSVIRQEAKGPMPRAERTLVFIAYALSALGTSLQLRAALWNVTASQSALRLLSIGFIALAVPLLLLTQRQRRTDRTWWIASLSIFAISGFHMASSHPGVYEWPLELFGHHASLPLAFAILFFDYRFAFADLFLKRALSLMLLVGLFSSLFIAIASRRMSSGLEGTAMMVAVAVLIALIHPWLRGWIDAFVDRVVLRRADYEQVRGEIARGASGIDDIPLLLDRVAGDLSAALATPVSWKQSEDENEGGSRRFTIASSEPPTYQLLVDLQRGRRLLSDDVALLENVAAITARRIDAIRLVSERVAQGAREEEMRKLTVEAELRALRAQINPHFLFNALNTVTYLISAAPTRALETLRRLTELLRRVLTSSDPWVTLGDELTIVETYLDIERARFEERLQVQIDVPQELRTLLIPTLVVQPLVENAVKHAISQHKSGGTIGIAASHSNGTLQLRVTDSGPGRLRSSWNQDRRSLGLGLRNIEQRLRALYGQQASFCIESGMDGGTLVTLSLPAEGMAGRDTPVRRGA